MQWQDWLVIGRFLVALGHVGADRTGRTVVAAAQLTSLAHPSPQRLAGLVTAGRRGSKRLQDVRRRAARHRHFAS